MRANLVGGVLGLVATGLLLASTPSAAAQAAAGAQDASLQTAGSMVDDRAGSAALAASGVAPTGGRGGSSLADFDSLIELITSTVRPTTWDEVGGPGSVQPFPTGVYVDPRGVLQPMLRRDGSAQLAALRASAAAASRSTDVRRASRLRMVSLPRLEKEAQLRLAAGRPLAEEMKYLAGLRRVEYVFVYPESRDLVIAGPAGHWAVDAENRVLATDTRDPVVRLDDLVVLLRHARKSPDGRFGCAITPTQDALARVQTFLAESNKRPIDAARRRSWLEQLRAQLGKQNIEVYGLDPRTRAARTMVEADYHMKLVGMGLAKGVPGVESYLASIEVARGGSPPPMGVLRWWFTLNYDALTTSTDRQAFALSGQGAQLLSENEMLTKAGEWIHTGQSEDLNRLFARSFTKHFAELAQKYPVYAELRNVFDLALVCCLIREEDLAGKVGWHMTWFGDPAGMPVELGRAPTQVDTVINHRVIRGVHIIAGVSGGVRADPAALVRQTAIQLETEGKLADRRVEAGQSLPPSVWWWDPE